MSKKRFLSLFLLGTLLLCVYFFFTKGSSLVSLLSKICGILLPFLLGGVIAFVLNIPMSFFEKKLLFWMDKKKWLQKLKRPVSILLVVIMLVFLVALFFSLVIPELARTLTSMLKSIPASVEKLSDFLSRHDISLGSYFTISSLQSIGNDLGEKLEQIIALALKGVAFSGTLIGSIYQNVISIVFTLIFSFYFLASKEQLYRQFTKLVHAYLKPERGERIIRTYSLVQETFSHFISRQCLEALILGTMMFLALSIFKFPYALLISLVTTLTAVIPIFGAWVAMIFGIVLLLLINPMTALWFALLFQVVQQIENNLIYPHVVGNAVGIPGIWVLFATLVGEGLFGILGMLVFIPLMSVVYRLLKEHSEHRLRTSPDLQESPAPEEAPAAPPETPVPEEAPAAPQECPAPEEAAANNE